MKRNPRSASCSDAQQLAEGLMIAEFSRELARPLGATTIPIGTARVEVDGFHKDDSRVTLVEVWAHVGKAKSAQRNKVLGDMLKLALVTSVLRRSYPGMNIESYLVFADVEAARVVTGKGWASLAAKEFGVESKVIKLSPDIVQAIREAQKKQDIRFECDEPETSA